MDHKDAIIQDLKADNKKLTEELEQLKKQKAAVNTSMERLTGRDEHGNANYPYCFREDTCKGYGASSKCDDCSMTTKICSKLAQYEDLEEQGLLLKIPVPLNSAVYSAECGMVVRDFVVYFTYDEKGTWAMNAFGGIIGLWGSTVFATEQEAQSALEKMKNGHDE